MLYVYIYYYFLLYLYYHILVNKALCVLIMMSYTYNDAVDRYLVQNYL